MHEIILNNLPEQHELRNIPLLGKFHRQKGTKAWKEIGGNYGIRNVTFNQLNKEVWTDTTEFMALVEPEMVWYLDELAKEKGK